MLSDKIIPKLNHIDELFIDNEIIAQGKMHTIRINAGKLPSDTRINVYAHILHTGIVGPSVLVLGGVHGNEINGIEIVRRSFENGLYNNVNKGTVIIIPLLNVYGFINFTRDVLDGKDVNRSFPGHVNGSLAARVARIITKVILPYVDIAIDFHTGGEAKFNIPQIRFSKSDPVSKEIAIHTGIKFLVEKPLIANSFRKSAHDLKIPAVVFEGGESIRLDSLSIDNGILAIKNLLAGLGMTDEKTSVKETPQILVHKSTWQRATSPGIFIWECCSGMEVQHGQKLGTIKDPFGTKSIDVFSKYSGYIIGHNNASVVSLGDALFHIGYEYSII